MRMLLLLLTILGTHLLIYCNNIMNFGWINYGSPFASHPAPGIARQTGMVIIVL